MRSLAFVSMLMLSTPAVAGDWYCFSTGFCFDKETVVIEGLKIAGIGMGNGTQFPFAIDCEAGLMSAVHGNDRFTYSVVADSPAGLICGLLMRKVGIAR